MDNDNPFEDDPGPAGRSVFGDDELPTGASVFGDVDGDDGADSERSVFGDVAPDTDEVPTEVIESPNASVFGDVPSGSGADESPVVRSASLDDWSTPAEDKDRLTTSITPAEDIVLDTAPVDGESAENVAPVASASDISASASVPAHAIDLDDLDEVPLDDGANDPIDLVGDPVTSIPNESSTDRSFDFDDDITTGEAIALDVDPGDEDGMEAWSDLGAAAPAWGDDDEAVQVETEASWDPGPLPEAEEEPAVVKIGATESERFFEFDDQAPENAPLAPEESQSSGSEMQSRIITGVALLAIAVVAINLGPLVALALIVIVVALAAGEFYNALRVAGYQPATLLGLAASVAMPIAVYFRGTQAVALVMALAIVFGLLWYLAGVASEMPVMNLGVTLLGVVYIGVLGSFGAALLETADRIDLNGDDGTGLLLAAIILTVGYDVGAFFSGRSMGRTPLTKVSPKKTVEGLIGGAVMTVVASVVFLSVINVIEPFSTFGSTLDAVILGVAAAIMAPLGDLGESLIKRDLGIKDMGSILPGHGGFLDRFDALLFVLPTVYFFSLAFFYGG